MQHAQHDATAISDAGMTTASATTTAVVLPAMVHYSFGLPQKQINPVDVK